MFKPRSLNVPISTIQLQARFQSVGSLETNLMAGDRHFLRSKGSALSLPWGLLRCR